MGHTDTIKGMERDYKHGRLSIERVGDMVVFSGNTYPYRDIIKGMGPRGGGAVWYAEEKAWKIFVEDLFDGDYGLLDGVTGGEVVRFGGYEDAGKPGIPKPTWVWA